MNDDRRAPRTASLTIFTFLLGAEHTHQPDHCPARARGDVVAGDLTVMRAIEMASRMSKAPVKGPRSRRSSRSSLHTTPLTSSRPATTTHAAAPRAKADCEIRRCLSRYVTRALYRASDPSHYSAS